MYRLSYATIFIHNQNVFIASLINNVGLCHRLEFRLLNYCLVLNLGSAISLALQPLANYLTFTNPSFLLFLFSANECNNTI